MSDKSKHGPHGPNCSCNEEEEEYVNTVADLREMLGREFTRFTTKHLEKVNPVTPDEEQRAKNLAREAALTALVMELSEGLVMSGIDTADSAAFFLRAYEQERNRVLLRNAQFVGVVPVQLRQEEQPPRPNRKAN